MDYVYCDPEDVDVASVAARFGCSVADIINLMQASGDWVVAALNGSRDALPPDGTILKIPTPPSSAACCALPPGARWMSWTAPSEDRLAALLMTLQRGPADTNKPIPNPGRLIAGDIDPVTRFVWHYYGNSDVRRAAMKASQLSDANYADAILSKGQALLVPVQPPTRIEARIAPSPVGSGLTGGTIDVDEGKQYEPLFTALHDLEQTLDHVDELRASIEAYAVTGNKLVQAFASLKESMEERAKAYGDRPLDENVYNQQFESGNLHRNRALEAIEQVLSTSQKAIIGQPVWTNFLESGALLRDLDTARSGVKAKIANQKMMASLVELFPAGYAMPLTTTKGIRTQLASYVCVLGARAALALDNQWDSGDLVGKLEILVRDESTKAGSACSNIIEYACACMRGFDGSDIAMTSPAPYSLFGVILTLFAVKPLKEAAAAQGGAEAAGGTAKRIQLQNVVHYLLGQKIGPLVKLATGQDWSEDDVVKEFQENTEPFKQVHEAVEGTQKALGQMEGTKEAAEKLEAVLSPFKKESGALRKLVPERARSVATALRTCLSIAGGVSGDVSAAQNDGVGALQGVSGMLAIAKNTTGAVKGGAQLAQSAKAIGLITDPTLLGKLDTTVKMLGEWSTVLGIAVDGCKVIENVDAADGSAESRLALGASLSNMTGNLVFMFAAAGGPICVILGGALLTAGYLIENRKVLAEELLGETVAKFDALADEPSAAKKWAAKFGFQSQWTAFVAAFQAARGDFATAKKLADDASALGKEALQGAEAIGNWAMFGD